MPRAKRFRARSSGSSTRWALCPRASWIWTRRITLRSPPGAKSAVGSAGTRKEYAWTFQTVPYPRLVSTEPADGDKNADPYGSFEMVFSAPIEPSTVMRNVCITPEPKATDVYTYYSRSDRRFVIQFDRKPSTDYTVDDRLAASATRTAINWAAIRRSSSPRGALDPSVYLNTPGQIGTYSAYTETKLYAVYRNIATMDFELARMSLHDFARVTGPGRLEALAKISARAGRDRSPMVGARRAGCGAQRDRVPQAVSRRRRGRHAASRGCITWKPLRRKWARITRVAPVTAHHDRGHAPTSRSRWASARRWCG